MRDFDLFHELMELTKKRQVQARFFEAHGRSLVIFKYHRKVFYDALWSHNEAFELARGIIFDTETKKVVSRPFDKVFNYLETHCTGEDFTLDQIVQAVDKKNGFLAVLTPFENGEMLITTTGTHDSDYAKLARREIERAGLTDGRVLGTPFTYMFEICSAEDPHIIPDRGVYLIGARCLDQTGCKHPVSEMVLDCMVRMINQRTGGSILRPDYREITFGKLLQEAQTVRHEGWMIRDPSSNKILFKLKSRYYLRMKYLSRSNWFLKEGITKAHVRKQVEEEFYPLIDEIFDVVGQEKFRKMSDLERLEVLERVLP